MVVYNRGILFLAGQIVDDTAAPGMDTYYGQARKVLQQVEELLEESGSSMQRILQVNSQPPLLRASYVSESCSQACM